MLWSSVLKLACNWRSGNIEFQATSWERRARAIINWVIWAINSPSTKHWFMLFRLILCQMRWVSFSGSLIDEKDEREHSKNLIETMKLSHWRQILILSLTLRKNASNYFWLIDSFLCAKDSSSRIFQNWNLKGQERIWAIQREWTGVEHDEQVVCWR